MNKLNIPKLLGLAKKATTGPWLIDTKAGGVKINIISPLGDTDYIAGDILIDDAQYIAACSPDKMIALLKYVQGLEEKREGTILIPEWLFEEYKKAMARLRELEPSLWPEKAND